MSETTRVVEGLFDDEGLLGGSCGACGRRHFPRAGYCPWCGTADPGEVRLAAEGTVWACTTVNAAPPGYDGPVPFGFGVVELAEDGLQVVTRLTVATDAERSDALAAIQVGDAVRFVLDDVGDGKVAWAFTPATAVAGAGGGS